MKKLRDAITSRSPESQQRIKEMADEMILKTRLQIMQKEVDLP
ncbi:hypothetical protein ACQ8YR_004362 [Yersinia enterocolitica]|nr:hypothetical protein [Yersinia enterocolitica]EEP94046.1 hypothetical protein yaldo0001_4310 [Yersinia aldovae ATCC 35236]UYK01717.1 hypothetical protein N4221_21610 [Yersinia enterocolitica]